MLNLDEQHIKTAETYWQLFNNLLPIAIAGGFSAMAVNLLRIAHEKTWVSRIIMLFSVIAVGCVAACIGALGISLFVPNPSAEVELLVGALAGSSGQKIFDIYTTRLFGQYRNRNEFRS